MQITRKVSTFILFLIGSTIRDESMIRAGKKLLSLPRKKCLKIA